MATKAIEFYTIRKPGPPRGLRLYIDIDMEKLSEKAQWVATSLTTTVRRPGRDDDMLLVHAVKTNRELRRKAEANRSEADKRAFPSLSEADLEVGYPGWLDSHPYVDWRCPPLYLRQEATREEDQAKAFAYLEGLANTIEAGGGDLRNMRGPYGAVIDGEPVYLDEQAEAERARIIRALFG